VSQALSRSSIPYLLRAGARIALVALIVAVMARILLWEAPPGWVLSRPTAAQASYALAAACALGWALGWGTSKLAPGVRAAEEWRRVALAAAAVWVLRPFLNPDFFGGIDSRWYGFAMTDALQQARSGVFPVLVGQGEFLFNGSFNPVRLAPYYPYFGMVLDLATARALQPVAIQHLTVVATGVLAAFTCYFCLGALAPARKGTAWAVSLLYVSAPALLAIIYTYDMYLTFMAFAWMPVVLWANIRLIRRDDLGGWAWLAASLALVWIGHAPVGAWLTLATGFMQGLRLTTRDASWRPWARALAGSVLFGALVLFFFRSVGELSGGVSNYDPRVFAASAGLLVGIAGMIRWLATGRLVWWALVAVPVWALQADTIWYAIAVGLALPVGFAGTRWKWLRVKERLPEWSLGLLLLGGLATLHWGPSAESLPALTWVRNLFPACLGPVSAAATNMSDLQVGWGLEALCAAGFAAAAVMPDLETRLLALLGTVLFGLVLPVPGMTRFLLSIVPGPLYDISTTLLWVRYVPVAAGAAVFLGFLGAAAWAGRTPRVGALFAVLAFLAAGWSLFEAQPFVRRGFGLSSVPDDPAAFYRTENVRMYNYLLRNLPASPYLVDGVSDYHLQSRLLRADDPAREIAWAPDWSAARTIELTSRPLDATLVWLQLKPGLTIAPGGRLLLRFTFFDRPYSGTLVCQGPSGFYREYYLPNAGYFPKSFGVDPARPKTLAFWNSRSSPQPVDLFFVQNEVPKDGRVPDRFARVEVLAYDIDKLPVRTISLIPYRAETTVGAPAFLETPRLFIPGYRATVNGREVPVRASPNQLVMVPLEIGANRIELRYPGTPGLHLASAVSAAAWLGLAAVGAVQLLKRKRATSPSWKT